MLMKIHTHTHDRETTHTHTEHAKHYTKYKFLLGKLKIKLMKMVINLLELLFHEDKNEEKKALNLNQFCFRLFFYAMLCCVCVTFLCY